MRAATVRYLPIAAAVLSAAAMLFRLLWPVPVGIADNHDGARLMCQTGAAAEDPTLLPLRNDYAVFRYPVVPPGTRCSGYLTSQAWPIEVISWFHRHVLGGSGAIDMREAIAAYALLVGAVIGVSVRLLIRANPWAALGFAVGLFVILADATFADYAGSPYSETAAMTGLLVFGVAGAMSLGGSRRRKTAFGIAWLAALFALMAKTQTAPLAIVFAAFFGVQRLEIRGLAGRHRTRVLPIVAALTLVVTARVMLSGGLLAARPPNGVVNVANEITMTVMPNADDPGDVAVGLGLPRSFGQYSGSNYWSAKAIENDPAFPSVAGKFTTAHLGGYLAGRPRLAARVLASGSGPYLTFRPVFGTYEAGTGHPAGAQECRECVVTGVAHLFDGSGFASIVAYWLATTAGALWLLRKSGAGTLARGFAAVSLVLIATAVVEYLTAVFGEGNEVTKHLVPSLFAATLAPLWIGVGAALVRKTRKPSEPAARPDVEALSQSPVTRLLDATLS